MRMIMTAMLLVTGLATLACRPEEGDRSAPGDARSTIPTTAPSITGVVTDVQPGGRIRIEERPDDSAGSAKAAVRLSGDATVLYRSGSRAGSDAIRRGMRVSAWFTGPVMESYPVQATANVIVIEAASP